MRVEFILYVADQVASKDFYTALLGMPPELDVPGMTEFALPGCKLGLMPEAGIARIISGVLPQPATGTGIPRCEVYLVVDDLNEAMRRATEAGARLIDAALERDWGHCVAYYADLDGHIVALARPLR